MTPCRPHSHHPRRWLLQRGKAAPLGLRNRRPLPAGRAKGRREEAAPHQDSAVLVPRRRKRQRLRKPQRRRKLARRRKPERQSPRPSVPREAKGPDRRADRLIQLLESARGLADSAVPPADFLPPCGTHHSKGSPLGSASQAPPTARRDKHRGCTMACEKRPDNPPARRRGWPHRKYAILFIGTLPTSPNRFVAKTPLAEVSTTA